MTQVNDDRKGEQVQEGREDNIIPSTGVRESLAEDFVDPSFKKSLSALDLPPRSG